MKLLKTLITALLITGASYAQFSQGDDFAPTIVTLTVDTTAATSDGAATNTFSDSIIIPNGMAPIGYFCDSLTYGATAYFQVAVGPTPTKWYTLCDLADTNAYSFGLDDSVYVPFTANVTASLMGTIAGIIGTYTSSSPIWIKLVISAAQRYKKYIYVRMRYF